MEFLTSDADIDLIQIGDQTVELVGFVHSKNAPQEVGVHKTYTVMKFLVTNKKGKVIQCSAWDAEIPVVEPKIQTGKIIHINGAYATQAKPQFNKGNVRFELSMKKHTEITILDDLSEMEQLDIDPVYIELDDLANKINQIIVFQANLKSPFQLVTQNSIASYGCAAICAKGYKVDMKVSTYDDTNSDNNSVKVGDFLEIKGYPREENDKYGARRLYVEVASMKDIKKLDGNTKTFKEMIRCVMTPQKKAEIKEKVDDNINKENFADNVNDILKKTKLY